MGRLKRKKSSGQKQSAAPVTNTTPSSEAAGTGTPNTGTKARKIVPPKKSSKPAKAVSGKKKPNVVDKSLQFLREVKVELKKVTWPSRKQTIGSTVVVLILAMIISLFLGVVDMGLSGLIRVILN